MKDTLTVIAPPENENCRMSLDRLVRQPFLLREKGSGTRRIFDDALADKGYTVEPVWECGNTETLLQAVAQGAGFSVVPRIAAEEALKRGRVISILIPEMELTQNFYIVTHRDKILTPAMEEFIEIVKTNCG